MTQDWMLSEIAPEVVRMLKAGNGLNLSEQSRIDIAIGLAFEKAMSRLPIDDASDLYCDLDENYNLYVAAIQEMSK
jgi:hypothetical protein